MSYRMRQWLLVSPPLQAHDRHGCQHGSLSVLVVGSLCWCWSELEGLGDGTDHQGRSSWTVGGKGGCGNSGDGSRWDRIGLGGTDGSIAKAVRGRGAGRVVLRPRYLGQGLFVWLLLILLVLFCRLLWWWWVRKTGPACIQRVKYGVGWEEYKVPTGRVVSSSQVGRIDHPDWQVIVRTYGADTTSSIVCTYVGR